VEAISGGEGSIFFVNGGLSREEEVVFRDLWKSKAPSKILAFSWTLLLDRIPTKRCVFSDHEDETVVHLFLYCHVISKVWMKVMSWLQFHFITLPNLFLHIICWSSAMRLKKLRRGAQLLWHSAIWVIWKLRNDRIFNKNVREVDEKGGSS